MPEVNSNKPDGVGRQAWALVVDRFESDAVRTANLFEKPPFGLIVQLAERLAVNQYALGSSPSKTVKLESYSSGEEGSLLNS